VTAAPALAEKLTVAMPGVPPVFGSVVTYVAKEEGFFKKHGVDVEGTDAGQGADVDVDRASVWHLVERVAAQDPAEIDRGAVEQLRAVPCER